MRILAAAVAASALVAGDAMAFVQPDYLSERPVETATGGRGRLVRAVSSRAPRAARKRFDALAAVMGKAQAIWDDATGVPVRIWGQGVAVPGAMADADVAAKAAERMLTEHLGLLAPGASPADFTPLANVLSHGVRTVTFAQHAGGLPVVGGAVVFEFEHDHLVAIGSTALPGATADIKGAQVDHARAAARAADWVGVAYAARPTAGAVTGPVVLPIVREPGSTPRVEYRTVMVVDVSSAAPLARWDVYVDAATGQPVGRTQKLRFLSGTVAYHVPVRYPGSTHMDYPATFDKHTVNGATVTSDASGVVTWTGANPATVKPGLAGTYATVTSQSGGAAAATLSLADGGTAVWDQSTSEINDAQLASYIHANIVKAYAIANLAPGLAYLQQSVPVFVNEQQTCNAYSNGDDIHFFRGDSTCENTGRIADVVYHEFGHSLHANSIIQGAGAFEAALSEGQADYLAMTITNDSGLGRGFDFTDAPLREADPPGKEYKWPDDVSQDPHMTGMIISGALWDLRKAMIDTYGQAEGVQRTDDIYYAIIQRSPDIPSSYVEALVQDDDDGDLSNGTPNQCLIQNAFAPHGLVMGAGVDLGVGAPTRDGFQVSVPITGGGNSACPPPAVAGVQLTWKLRDTPATGGTVAMTADASAWSGAIPTQPDGTVVQYQVVISFADGSGLTYPDNAADPFYQFFVGPVIPIKCWDFETSPDDWTHGAKQGVDEWEWGAPDGTTSNTDPTTTHGGNDVFGMDLGLNGGDGVYESQSDEYASTPEVDVTGYTNVRLQYWRWLNVEDGFFDQATISADGDQLWANFDSNMGNDSSTAHRDREWRFHDVDLSAEAADGKVQVTFELQSDPGLEYGGWTLDDVCIVAYTGAAPPSCGNGTVETGEQCDDGNTVDGDGCSSTCQNEAIDPTNPPGGCCSASGGSSGGPLVLALGVLLVGFRRRRPGRARP